MAKLKRTSVQDAIALLKADHREVERLFKQFEKAKGAAAKTRLAETICLELSVHTAIEEEIFYPAVRGPVEDDLLDESHVEHDTAKCVIGDILSSGPAEDFYDAKLKVLSELIKHHVKEEEQRDGLFAQARKGKIDLLGLGEAMAARKEKLSALYDREGIPAPLLRTMHKPKVRIGRPIEK